MNIDLKEAREIVLKIINQHGNERAVALLLMSLGNVMKHLARECGEESFNKIMKDPVIGLSANYAAEFMNVRK